MKKKAKEYYENKIKKLEDYEDRIFENQKIKIEKIKNVHFSAVCGKAMASLAGLFSKAGYSISGSDNECYPPMSTILEKIDLTSKKFSENNLLNKDIIVVGNVCTPNSLEAKYARENSLIQISSAQAVADFFIKDKISMVVSGTHGKTTTTSLLAHIFIEAKKNPAYLIGGVMKNTNSSYDIGNKNSKHFIIEGDEYDTAYFDKAPKFLHYKATKTIITSIEFDHADIYEDLNDYRNAFKFLANETKDVIIICDEINNYKEIIKDTKVKIIKYGFKKDSDIYAENIKKSSNGQYFDLIRKGKKMGQIFIPLSGDYNILNTIAVCELALSENIDFGNIKKALSSFKNVAKRQEILVEVNGIKIIDDFAHHPTAVFKTLKGLKDAEKKRRLIAVFEPRSSTSRRKDFEDDYKKSFKYADIIFIKTPPFRKTDKKENFMNPDNIIDYLKKEKQKEAYHIQNKKDLIQKMKEVVRKNDNLVFMSNGSFDNIQEDFIKLLKN